MADILRSFLTRFTKQTSKARTEQVQNSAGGFVFQVNDLTRLRRFLTLGTEGGTYYAKAQDLTRENAEVVVRMAEENPKLLVDTIVEISTSGRAPKQNPSLFALAIAASLSDDAGRSYALSKLPEVARIGTHLFLFTGYIEQFRGWGRSLRRAVGSWYTDKTVDDVAYQMAKYRAREGWSHRDVLRLAHPVTEDPARAALLEWAARGEVSEKTPALIKSFTKAQSADVAEAVELIQSSALSWEMLPTKLQAQPEIWYALLAKGMPINALIRQLPRLTRLNVLDELTLESVIARLTDQQVLRKGRVHPINILVAQRTYASGKSARGDGTWTPLRQIVDALDEAFYLSFGNIEPTGGRTLLALDVSSSMTMASISGMPITPCEASAALALATAKVEKSYDVVGFTGSTSWRHTSALTELTISPRQRLDDVIRTVSDLPFGTTDCALPMLHALEKGRSYDTFVIYTDNDTWSGNIHPFQALQQYRRKTGIDAKLVVVGMTSTGFSIADPKDPGMLDVAGFDSATPNLISDFARGLI